MTTTHAPRAPRVAPDHGDGEGLELEWCGPAEGGRVRLDPRRSLLGIGIPASAKTCLTQLLARRLLGDGGQVVAVDTGTGEYVEAPGPARHSRVVDPMAGTTLDPLRLFAGQEALEHATAVFTMLAGLTDVDWYARTATALAVGMRDAVDHGARSLVEAAQVLEASDDPDTSRVGAQVVPCSARACCPSWAPTASSRDSTPTTSACGWSRPGLASRCVTRSWPIWRWHWAARKWPPTPAARPPWCSTPFPSARRRRVW